MKFFHHTHSPFRKKRRFDPHHAWMIFCSAFIILLIFLLAGFTWYFIRTTERVDAPVTPTLNSNAEKITAMQQTLDIVESAIQSRTNTQ